MTKFEIMTDSFEFRFTPGRPIPRMTEREILDTYFSLDPRITSNSIDPETVEAYDTEEDAREAFWTRWRDYGETRPARSAAGIPLLIGRLAFIQINDYDAEGEFDQGGDTLDLWSAEGYEPED